MTLAREPIIDRLESLRNTLANERADVLDDAGTLIIALLAAVRYADTRAVSRAAYPHACIEERKLRDLIDEAIKLSGGATI